MPHPFAIPAAHGRPSTNAYAKKREKEVEAFLTTHPATAAILVELGMFPNLDRACRRLKRMYERGQIGFMRYVEIPYARRSVVYSKYQISSPLHELELTKFCLNLQVDEIRSLRNVDRRFNADAEVIVGSHVTYVEYDRATESMAQVKKQMLAYENVGADVVWIVPDKKRMTSIMAITECPMVWFTTYQESKTPHENVWVNAHGERASLPTRGATV